MCMLFVLALMLTLHRVLIMNFLVSITIIIMSNIISVDYSTISVANHAKNGSNFIPQLAGEAHQLGYHKIVLDHCIYIYYDIYII